MIYQHELQLQTSGHRQMHDLTEEVAQVVSASRIRAGVVNVFNVGSTGAIGTIEFEPGLQKDLPMMLDKLLPPSREYGHEQAWHDGNGHSHLQATLLGPSLTVPIKDGKLALRTWQQVFHLECDVKPHPVFSLCTQTTIQVENNSFDPEKRHPGISASTSFVKSVSDSCQPR